MSEAAIVNGALEFERFTNEQIRKVALDMCDIARQIKRDNPEDDNMKDVAFRLTKMSVLLIGYFPDQPEDCADLKEHTSSGC